MIGSSLQVAFSYGFAEQLCKASSSALLCSAESLMERSCISNQLPNVYALERPACHCWARGHNLLATVTLQPDLAKARLTTIPQLPPDYALTRPIAGEGKSLGAKECEANKKCSVRQCLDSEASGGCVTDIGSILSLSFCHSL